MNSRTTLILSAALVLVGLGCGDEKRRPAAAFNHSPHDQALKGDCKACHEANADGAFVPTFKGVKPDMDREARMALHHERCIGCHTERAKTGDKTGPRTCAECHKEQTAAKPVHAAMRFDSGLHARHVEATDEKCERCHHVYDKAQKKLVYKKDAEGACADCHKAKADGKTPSLKGAAHKSCVGCHLEGQNAKQAAGPVQCAGCHSKAAQAKFEKVKDPKRLVSGQKDRFWILTKGAKAQAVAFDHEAHEKATPFCTTCHHQSKKACGTCHAPGKASKDGGGVSLEIAQHHPTSTHSCIGCHQQATRDKECAGCHEQITTTPGKNSCATCHNGAAPDQELPAAPIAVALPESSEAFPETIEIKVLANKYQPSKFPHRKIVAALAKISDKSKLASRFHGQPGTLCAGCHHQSPRGATPPPCKSCHGPKANPDKDQPGLTAAYHRQCIGCHKSMGLKQTGCTDCHAKASKEVTK